MRILNKEADDGSAKVKAMLVTGRLCFELYSYYFLNPTRLAVDGAELTGKALAGQIIRSSGSR